MEEHLKCPITLCIMREPVTDCNGHTFERSAIETWYNANNTSPVTGAIVANKNLVVNYAIKQLIESSITEQNPKPSIAVIPTTPAISSKPRLPQLSANTSIFKWNDKNYLHVELSSDGQEFQRKPITCIAVIDTSGSMGERASPYNPCGENDGFSRLDLVKHSLATIYKSLSPGDKLAIITFNSAATLLLPACDVSNSRMIDSSITGMRPGGQTNIWAGLKMACDLANEVDYRQYNASVLLLTDGVANYNPPRGIIPTFDSYFTPGKFPIHTFAYGYDVDSATLVQISQKSQGVFGFIPDGTMVGTIFINAMSAMLTTVYNDVKLEFCCGDGTTSETIQSIHVGAILHGQKRNVLLEYDLAKPPHYYNVCYNDFYSIEPIGAARIISNLEDIAPQMARWDIKHLLSKPQLQITTLKNFIAQYANYSSSCNFIKDLLTDCYDDDLNRGQIGKAISRMDWFRKWGCHYLPSLESAYRMEMCLNFKDLAPQHYVGSVFKAEQARVEEIFSNITPPEPSIFAPQIQYSGNQAPVLAPSYATIPQTYYDASGGCFTDGWQVMIPGGVTKPVKNIRAGDLVISNDAPNGVARVICVVRLMISNTFCMISPDGQNGITSYHPVWLSLGDKRNWQFPEQITEQFIVMQKGDYMYDFIIDKGYSIAFECGINAACLGHECRESEVIAHNYFGTHKILDDLKDHEDWNSGYITLDSWRFIRNESGLVVKLEF